MPRVITPPSGSLDLALHIGSGKTGTSSIQYFLHRNRARLADLGHLYPRTPGRTRHTRLGLFAKPDSDLARTPAWRRESFPSPAAFRRSFRRSLFAEINDSGLSRVLLSDESLFGSSEETLRRLSRFVHRIAGSLRLVVYLRRQDDHLASRYQQVVKVGETRRLAERMQQLDLSGTYDYSARLRTWERLLTPTEFVVRRFERDSFVDGSLYQDFLTAAGIDVRADDLERVEARNESLDAEAVEFLRLVNLVRVENPEKAALVGANHGLVTRLAQARAGPTLTVPAPILDAFMARWQHSNERVAREILGDETGQLFHMPRSNRTTATEQRLDPDRLDHFLVLLELPEAMHAPLRAVVEREARVG